MKQDLGRISKEEVFKKIENLSEEETIEVVDFIESLHRKRRGKDGSVLHLLEQVPGSRIGLKALRVRLAKIRGKMSDTVCELRNERG